MLQRLIAAVLGVLGLLAIGLGVASSTVWRGDDILVATASPDAHLVVAEPGVLELAGNPVTITVHAANDTPVVIAVGRDTDVSGWVGTDAHSLVTGLAGWHALRTESVAKEAPTPSASAGTQPAATEPAATGPAATAPSASATSEAAGGAAAAVADPAGSDLWVAQATGKGTATLTWDAQPGRWSLLVASLGESSPVVELAWPRTVTTPWLWPGVVGGALLLLGGLGLGARLWLRARRGLTEPEWHPVLTGAMPTVAAPGAGAGAGSASADATETVALTRRQMREAEASSSATRRRGRGAPDAAPTGSQPLLVPGAGREAIASAPARADDAHPPVSPTPAPATGPAPAGFQPAARREAGPGAVVAPADREWHPAEAPRSTPSGYGSRALAGQPSGAPVSPHAAQPHLPAAPPPSTAALPSYFLRPSAADAARTAPRTPVAPGGWVPGGAQPESPRPGTPAMVRPAAAHGAAQPAAAAVSGPDRTVSPRATWVAGKPVVPDEPPADQAGPPAGPPAGEQPSARADAWRRAWGFPGHDAGGADDAAGDSDEGTHR